ncbi:SNAP25 homologous protein SNAP33 [Andrographis paniculata]|uniref:SNAP25 homologous protein SNAP33 n=1 Tax=Andrographis paniculata TaxID=175694 RepID=UPI0021E700FA|nr:SNAP25 homologous protein SNAP33 [Andrographis paniculata]
MSGLTKSPLNRFSKHNIGGTKFSGSGSTNPFDSDDELDNKQIRKSSGKTSKHNATNGKFSVNGRSNPFDSDDEIDNKLTLKTPGRKSSEPSRFSPGLGTNPFDDDDDVKDTSSSRIYHASATKNRYKNGFRDAGGLENQTVEELESYALYKAEETTNAVNNCLMIAEDMRESATKTLVTLHQQGEQLTHTHMVAADIDQDLSRGEKLLGSLGGMFSRTWKPKKTRPISGPVITRDDPVLRKGNHLEQREKLGLISASKERRRTGAETTTEPANALQKVEVEKLKQDDALLDLSNILGELKEMALDMGSEIDRQNKAMDHFQDDVEELSFRVKGANQRTRRLLGK